MSETRYLKIESCLPCPYTGHTTSCHNHTITYFCTHPENMRIDKPKEKVGNTFYPITHITEVVKDSPIPYWCKLPSKVV